MSTAGTGSGDRSAPNRLLPDWDDRLPWKKASGAVTATEILRGSDETDLVVVLAHAPAQPTKGDLQAAWRARSAGGVTPVLLAVTYRDGSQSRVALLGLTEDAVPVTGIDQRVAEQLISDALVITSPSGLHTEVRRRLSSVAGGVASGVRNEGLLASHVLQQQPRDPGWEKLCARSRPLLGDRSDALLTGLGYAIEPVPDGTVLREIGAGNRRAAAVLLADGESFDNPLSRFHNTNAVTHGLAVARRENVDWLIVLGGSVVRLYPRDPDAGVGRKGQTQTYVELDLSILAGEECGYLALLFAPVSLAAGGALYRLLGDSSRYAAELSARLRDRIYEDVVRNLSLAVAGRMGISGLPSGQQKAALDEAYHRTMIILFRLLFVAYAEDRGLLPYGRSDRYTRNALKTLALDLQKDPRQKFDPHSTSLWDDLTQVWKVIDTGDLGGWGVPAYNGGLFTRDPDKNASGAATYRLDLTNDQIGPALRGLLLDVTDDGYLGPVDFRSLSVREFGTIYEGLLESGLDLAEADLTLDGDAYLTAQPSSPVAVPAGQVYFHSRSGSRKATGSYFTKPFAVEHLLDSALEPAIDTHLARVAGLLRAGATKSAAEALFDFRVADLAMGSGHFLVAAVDRIEARFSAFTAENPMPEVALELHHLRRTAASQLGLPPESSGIDDGVLLRRLIARRCIYGVDINEIAVELARLAIWIHTFVPGLPLSFLNHGLIRGNSLTGVGTISEISQALADAERRELRKQDTKQGTVLDDVLDGFLDRAKEHLAALGELSDAHVADVDAAATLQAQLVEALEPLAALCDLITAERATRYLGSESVETVTYDKHGRNPKTRKRSVPHRNRVLISANPELFTATGVAQLEAAILAHPGLSRARQIAGGLGATHFPVAFPEVFRRTSPGFDVILGNPPWDKVRHEPQQFWVTASPGLNRLPDTEREAEIARLRATRPMDAAREQLEMESRAAQQEFFKTAFVLRGGTHIELAQLVLERAIAVLQPDGQLGLVLPRQFTVLAGWSRLRQHLVTGWELYVVQGRNHSEWIFDGIDVRYAAVFLSAARSEMPRVSLAVANSIDDIATVDSAWIQLSVAEIASLSETYVLPWFATRADREVFDRMRAGTRLASGAGWITGHHDARWDFRGSGPDKALASHTRTSEAWRVLMTAHVRQFGLNQSEKYKQFIPDLAALVAKDRGVVSDSGDTVLGSSHPLIVVRHPSRSDDSRTLIATALPQAGLLHNKGYVHAIAVSGAPDPERVLALLGYVNTVVADWWARRFVDRHVTAPVVNQLALPEWTAGQIAQAASATSALLARRGYVTLAGGVRAVDATDADDNELLTLLNRLALDGFGLSREQLDVISSDFNEKGFPLALREKIAATFLPEAEERA